MVIDTFDVPDAFAVFLFVVDALTSYASLAVGTEVATFAVGFRVSPSYNPLLLLETGATELLT